MCVRARTHACEVIIMRRVTGALVEGLKGGVRVSVSYTHLDVYKRQHTHCLHNI